VDALFTKRRNFAPVAPIDDADLRIGVDLAHEADAARAKNAAVAVEHQRGPEVHVGLHAFPVEDAAGEVHAAFRRPEGVGEVLQRTLAALVADRAVERMVDQEELEDAGACLHDLGVARLDDHPIGANGRA
jgi:hypothetical protein